MKQIGFFPACICALALSACSYFSGGADAARTILGVSEPPMFLSAKAVSQNEVRFEFSKPVTIASLHFSPQIEVGPIENGGTVTVGFSGNLGPGEKVTADILARDEDGNTVSVLVPFRTRNERIPPLRITELRTEYSKPRAEFIELRTFAAGNLGALRVFVAGNAKSPLVYEFPPVEVRAMEYVTLHLRKLDENSRDELGSNLAESSGADSSTTARDLWIPGTAKLLRKTDIVYILDQDDGVVDAVALSENADPVWRQSHLADAAEFLFRSGAWKSADGIGVRPTDAVRTAGTTATRTINRNEALAENSRSPADWYITVTSGATPGKPNNPKRHGE